MNSLLDPSIRTWRTYQRRRIRTVVEKPLARHHALVFDGRGERGEPVRMIARIDQASRPLPMKPLEQVEPTPDRRHVPLRGDERLNVRPGG